MASLRRIFAENEVLDLHREALRVVAELDPPEDLRQAVYGSVIAMLGQHQAPQAIGGLPAMAIPQGR